MLREKNVNRESKSRSSQFSYTDIVNMKVLAVVIPLFIYHYGYISIKNGNIPEQ